VAAGVIDELIARMTAMLEPLQADGDQRRYFHVTFPAGPAARAPHGSWSPGKGARISPDNHGYNIRENREIE